MRAIDVHAHIFPPKIERTATDAIRGFYDRPVMKHSGSPEELLESGRRAGVTNYVVFTTATTPKQVTVINDFICAEAKKHPEFIPVGTMHRDYGDIIGELDRMYDMGLRGIKLHPDFQRFCFDDDKLLPMYRHMEKKDMFVITHSGDVRYEYSQPTRVRRIAEMFPSLRIVAAHFGGWSQWELARRILVLPNVYVDTSSTFGFGGADEVKRGIDTFDNSHIFFGDDFPMWDHADEIEKLRALGLGEELLDDILYGNFARFYGFEIYGGGEEQ